jgi:hypothetical protein
MLPRLLPMLAVPAAPFDSVEYSFEVKWDGIRVLAAVDKGGWQLWGRERAEYTARYPELDVLRRLPAGTLMDGEVVACATDGRPDLPRLLRRHGLTDLWRIRQRQFMGTRQRVQIENKADHLLSGLSFFRQSLGPEQIGVIALHAEACRSGAGCAFDDRDIGRGDRSAQPAAESLRFRPERFGRAAQPGTLAQRRGVPQPQGGVART